jgi:predicted dehydrogenase
MSVHETGEDGPVLGVAMIGYAFMGAAHSQGWRNAHRFFDLPARPELNVICGRSESATRDAAGRLGWAGWTTDWRDVLDRDDIQVVDICTPGDTHAEIALAALAAGKHVLCEKPLANSVAEAEAMTAAADAAQQRGVLSSVGFNYRRTPALAHARRLVEDGAVGTIRHIRAQYLQDWIVDPEFPLVWRLQKDKAGSGALGDIGAHIIDLSQFLTGQRLTEVAGHLTRFVDRRPLPAASSGLSASGAAETGTVTVDDAAVFFGRTDGGALATYEATRFATGPQERHADRDQRLGGQHRLRLRGDERAARVRRHRARRGRGLPPDLRHRARPSLHRGVVAALPRPRLRAHVRPRDRRLRA